jgi:alpha-tubulin suppressor-like RCC1 family protein
MIVLACGSRAQLDTPAIDAGLVDVHDAEHVDPTGPPIVATSVAAGWWQTCAVLPDTGVACWGHGTWIGSPGGVDGITVGARFGDLTNVDRVALGGGSGCALLFDRTMRCWGHNENGVLGDGTAIDQPSPVAVPGVSDVLEVAVGNDHTCALGADGEVRCWGRCDLGQIGDGDLQNYCSNTKAKTPATGVVDATQITAGGNLSCAVTQAGASCWGAPLPSGSDPNQVIDVPTNIPGFGSATQISAEWSYICARMYDASVACIGDNSDTFEDAGDVPSSSPVTIDLPPVVEVHVGYGHACARAVDGSVWCWGENRYGQLGDGTYVGRQKPARVQGIVDAVQLTVGEWHSCVLLTSGQVACWGRNAEGECADGTRDDRNTPVIAHWDTQSDL